MMSYLREVATVMLITIALAITVVLPAAKP